MSHLHPKDLLALSRSSKHLHSLLMTSDASPYWRAARRSIDLPNGPPTINEAQYASLMFERKCTVSTRAGRAAEGAMFQVWGGLITIFEYPRQACGFEDTNLRFTQAYARFCDICYVLKYVFSHGFHLYPSLMGVHLDNSIRSHDDAFRALRTITMLRSHGLDFGLFVSEFEMVLPGSIDSYMSRRASRQNGGGGWFYFPEFKVVVEEYTRVKYDPEALKAFTKTQMLAVRESLQFRARRGRWMACQDAKDRILRSRRNEREAEFLAIFRQHLPKDSERNPLQPPDEMVLREVAGLDDFLMERDGETPVTLERMKTISGSLATHCEAFNRKIRRMMVVISKRFPMDKPFGMTDDECYEYLCRATTIFLMDTQWGQEWHTYQSFTFKMREVKEKKVLFGMLDDFYVNEDYSDRVGALLACMGLPRTATLGAAVAKQTGLKAICRCRNTGFKQPGSFIELVSHSAEG